MGRCGGAGVLVTALCLCLTCALVVAYSAFHFTRFTWKDSLDVHPCEMSYFHLTHFPTAVHSSTSASSPTHDSRLNHRPANARKGTAPAEDNAEEGAHQHTHLYAADAAISNHSVAESVDAAHAAGLVLISLNATQLSTRHLPSS